MECNVVLAKCSKTLKLFGIRVEKRGIGWVMTWAFPIDEKRAKNEGFDKNTVNIIGTAPEYPGCPYCKNPSFAMCMCQKIGCCNPSVSLKYKCPWCNRKDTLVLVDEVNATGGGY